MRNFENIVELIGDRIRLFFDTDDPNLQDQILEDLEYLMPQLDDVCITYCRFLKHRRETLKGAAVKYLGGHPFRKR